jgi:peroxiredoxin Q/BCP
MRKLSARGVEVVGVSGDKVETQALFKKAHELPYTLLADFDGKVAKAFGVPLRDGGVFTTKVDGKEYDFERGVTCGRWTFLVDRDAKIAMKNTKVDAGKDSKAVLELVEELTKDE